MQSKLSPSAKLLPFAVLFFAACSNDLPLAPAEVPITARRSAATSADFQLARCPTRIDRQVSASIGPQGGKLEVEGHSLTIPAGAVQAATRFTLHAPAGPYLRLELTARDTKHFEFERPASVTISYERCRRQHRRSRTPTAWYLDDNGHPERQESWDDPVAQTVTFQTLHLSTYAVIY
jgi:hypothetical protein